MHVNKSQCTYCKELGFAPVFLDWLAARCATAHCKLSRGALLKWIGPVLQHVHISMKENTDSAWFARIPLGKTFVFWQPARKCMQFYHDYASFCPAKHDVYSVLSTEGGLNVNIGHIVYIHVRMVNYYNCYLYIVWSEKLLIQDNCLVTTRFIFKR